MAQDEGSTLLRLLEIVEAVSVGDRPRNPTEINDQLGYPKATIHRLCSVLEREGWLQRELDGKRLSPGRRLYRMALGVLSSEQHRAHRHTVLVRLSRLIGETCNISIPDGSQMRYIDRVETHWPLRMQLPIGSRVPLYCTAAGKTYLASFPKSRRRSLIAGLELQPRVAKTLTTPDALEAELEKTSERGYGLDDEEFVEGMVCVAVPIYNDSKQLFATLSFHAPTSRMSLQEALQFVPQMQEAARELADPEQ
jgi:IclR family acetate operon transcriptional repressor